MQVSRESMRLARVTMLNWILKTLKSFQTWRLAGSCVFLSGLFFAALPILAAEPADLFVPGEVLVKLRSSRDRESMSISHLLPGAVVEKTFGKLGWQLVRLPEGMSVSEGLKRLRDSREVSETEPNYRLQLLAGAGDPKASDLWGLQKIGAPKAWGLAGDGPKVVVGVIDSGVNYRHPDLAANIWKNPGEIAGNGFDDDQNGYVDDVYGIDLMDGDSDPMDDHGHGSHVAGTIAAVRDNGLGVVGVSPQANIMAVRIFAADKSSSAATAVEAFLYAIDLKDRGVNLRVLNCSWGSQYPNLVLKTAISAAEAAGISVVCGAGNEHQNSDYRPFFPANYDVPGVISVVASTEADEPAFFSNYGETTAHLAAPGLWIPSTYKGGPDYATMSGTSMAAPHVSGAAALLLSRQSDLTPAAIKSLLIRTADRLPAWEGKAVANGRLNLAKAMETLVASPNANAPEPRPVPRTVSAISAVSRNNQGFLGDLSSSSVSISGDGRFLVFVSAATNLAAGDSNDKDDVFLHDRMAGTTIRISQSATGEQGDDDSGSPVISEDGDHVAFESLASNLVFDDTNNSQDIFLFHRLTGQIEMLSLSPEGIPGDGHSGRAGLSGAGRYVVFASAAANLVSNDRNGLQDVFLRDTELKSTTRLSVGRAGVESDGLSDRPAISRDGRYVAFHSAGATLVPNDRNGAFDVFVYDRETSQLELASQTSSGLRGNDDSAHPSISADGRFVAFQSWASNLEAGDANFASDVFLRDRQESLTRRISVGNNRAAGDADSRFPFISADGRYVVFESAATSLIQGDTGLASDIFLYDRLATKVSKLTFNALGLPAGNDSAQPRLSGDGRFVAFQSLAFNLVPGDGNAVSDIFVLDRGAASADLLIRSQGETSFAGDGVIGHAVMQRKSQSVGLGGTATYELRLDNTGQSTNSFSVVGTGSQPGWKVQLFDALSAGRLIASDARSAGWTTPPLPPGSNVVLRLEVTPVAFTGSGQTLDIELKVALANSRTALDAVHAVTFRPFSSPEKLCASRANDGTMAPDNSSTPSLSADGRFVAYASDASGLVANDYNASPDIFVFDRAAQRTVCVSRPADGSVANGPSENPSLSRDGRFIAFQSRAGNLVPKDTNGRDDIFVKDRILGTIQRVSVASDNAQASRGSQRPVISGDGQAVAFESLAENLTALDGNQSWDIFVHHRTTGQTICASRAPNGETGNGDSLGAAISADGRYVAFDSYASNLVPQDTNNATDVFVFDVSAQTLELVSKTQTGAGGNGPSSHASISADGRHVLFASTADDLVAGDTRKVRDLFLYDREQRQLKRIETELTGFGHTLSPNGRWIGFTAEAPNHFLNQTNRFGGVFLYEIQSGLLTQMSRTRDDVSGNDHSQSVAFSADGRYVAYASWAPNLRGEAGYEASQIFVFDQAMFQPDEWLRREGDTASRGRNLFSLEGQSLEQLLSLDATNVTRITLHNSGSFTDRFALTATAENGPWSVRFFESASGAEITGQIMGGGWGTADLALGEKQELQVVFQPRTRAEPIEATTQKVVLKATSVSDPHKSDAVQIVAALDADADELPDAWEIRYFGSTVRGAGNADFDGDGFSDRAEYNAGTNPTNAVSALRITQVEKTGSERISIRWASEANRYYSVARSAGLGLPFEKVNENLRGTPPENIFQDVVAADGRTYFYRIEVQRP